MRFAQIVLDFGTNSPPELGGVPSAARRGGSPAELLPESGFGTTAPARRARRQEGTLLAYAI
jgi:hypothetical protein